MRFKSIIAVILLVAAGTLAAIILSEKTGNKEISIITPFNDALFPPEFPAPLFEWYSEVKDTSSWEVSLSTRNGKYVINDRVKFSLWSPGEAEWENLKKNSHYGKILFTVSKTGKKKINERITFTISSDTVGAPILYRQMPIPFALAEKKLEAMNYMLLDPGSKDKPHIAMKGFPVCGNCHSFSADGKKIGLDLDAGLRDKGGYFTSSINDTVLFNQDNYRSWSRIEKRRTFGLFSKLSPDGRYTVTTVKDRVIIKNYPITDREHVAFSQLFFPVNGHLAVYDSQTKTLRELQGANLDEYVQSNAVWTPDGKNIIFSRARALPFDSSSFEINVENNAVVDEYAERKKTLKFDLCIIPFNDGNGGEAIPVEGASGNGKSNYFPAVSPDGKWIVFCQAESFMLLMPDSKLYIVPLKGGKARMLKSNLSLLNSWHAWSPNSRWLVFSSKGLSPYTDMFMTHIDEDGNASVPVLVDKAREVSRVINYPEFINQKEDFKFIMEYDYVELAHINRMIKSGNIEQAKQLFHRLESQKPFLFSEDCTDLSYMLSIMGLKEESLKYAEMAKHTINSSLFNQK